MIYLPYPTIMEMSASVIIQRLVKIIKVGNGIILMIVAAHL
jgi:hypothetical protein